LRFTGWLSIAGVLFETLLVIILQSIAFGTNAFGERFDLQVYSGCFIWSFVYLAYILIDTVLQENIIQMYAFNILHLAYLGFAVYQVYQVPTAVFIASTIVLISFFIIYPVLTKYLHVDFGWRIYRKIGADPKIKALFRNYQIFLVCMKGTFLLTMLFLVQQVFIVLGFQNYETYLDIITPPIWVLVWFLSVYAIKHENKYQMLFFITLALLGIVYFTYKVIIFHTGAQYLPGGKYQYIGTVILTQTAIYCWVCYAATSFVSILIYVNFGKGLSDHLLDRSEREAPPLTENDGGLGRKRSMKIVED
jgi:hypothetical protein